MDVETQVVKRLVLGDRCPSCGVGFLFSHQCEVDGCDILMCNCDAIFDRATGRWAPPRPT